ncbi:A disintegrin and metalloproteinase with thrombospondin motifs 2-like [Biomphalaria glabrata]|uniref:A disintegrin and metalloproteinase with thrombospondin motifs 2-like n=1 Tax=Biomphalaria glabrata TaxID=6526 RepID=A0A9W3BIT0_BIOGL|nr:A disintegrin and metalloproteinase with thrombospondin motifs 2-like [Biomphalaria glabrata]
MLLSLRHSVSFATMFIFHLLFVASFCVGYQITAKISITAANDPQGHDVHMPDELEVNITLQNNVSARLRLTRAGQLDPDVPIYTLSTGTEGERVIRREEPVTGEKPVYYQDINSLAVMEVTSVSVGEKSPQMFKIQKGVFHWNSTTYSITPTRRKREAISEVHSFVYNIEQTQLQETFERVTAPPEYVESKALDDREIGLQQEDTESVPQSEDTKHSDVTLLKEISRRKRQDEAPTYFVDVTAFLDYTGYQRFLERSHNDSMTCLSKIHEYFAFIFTGIDLIYQEWPATSFQIRIRLTKIIIFQDPAVLPIPANNESMYQNLSFSLKGTVNAYTAIYSFWEFLNSSQGREMSYPYDHAMLFIGSDLWSPYPEPNNGITGLAAVGTLCRTDGTSSSVIEDLGDYFAMFTGAHELGHSLSALHDGMSPGCQADDFYLMAPLFTWSGEAKKLHPWRFSNCSVAEITTYVETLRNTSSGKMCLSDTLIATGQVPDVSDRLLGLEYPPNQQCTLRYGQRSFDCRLGNASDMCTSLWCYKPSDDLCYTFPALMGTSCGNRKVCKQGLCLDDKAAPPGDSSCMFGDSRMNSSTSCADGIQEFAGHCYIEQIANRCCNSCSQVRTSDPDCLFGDHWSNCSSDACSSGSGTEQRSCCYTCRNTTSGISTEQTTSHRIPAGDVCNDDDNFRHDGKACADTIQESSALCWVHDIRQSCCRSCRMKTTNVTGCKYGDENTALCSSLPSCQGYDDFCCYTCRGYDSMISGVARGFNFDLGLSLLVLLAQRSV